MSAVAFNRLLHDMGVQYKAGKTWLLYQKYSGLGYTLSRTYPVNEYTVALHTYWTSKGRLFLYGLLKEYGVVPQAEALDAAACC
jgi:phage antirepressor YoqD-like protein